jgi:hypothetical protein
MKPFAKLVDQAMAFEGFMTPPNIRVFQLLLADQRKRGVRGNLIEFGVYKGRSASVLLDACRADELLFLVEPGSHPDLAALARINRRFKLLKGRSEDLIRSSNLTGVEPPIRFSHHDASHTFSNVTAELGYMEGVAGPDAVLVLDDFGNWLFPQVAAATHAHLLRHPLHFELFLIGDNKAYLCRREHSW